LAAVPVAWDDTLLLAGTPRTHAVVARRKGDNWWIAGIAGTLTAPDTPETIGVNSMLDFLDSNTYDCRLVTQDPQDPRILLLSEQPLTAADSLEVTLSAREGFVAHLTPHP
jgi:alpha-glucosidase